MKIRGWLISIKMVFLAVTIISISVGFTAQIFKPIAELDLLNDQELRREAAGVCKLLVFLNVQDPQGLRAKELALNRTVTYLEYLQTISLVARKKNGGEFPQWVSQIKKAASGSNREACDVI